MRLFIIRHGKAHQGSASGTDFDRELKSRGEAQSRWLGRELASRDDAPELIITSPVVRARTTAQILNESLDAELVVDERLDTETVPSVVLEAIADHRGSDSLALVGHNPTLSTLAGVLSGEPVGLRTGECAAMTIDPDNPIGSGTGVEMLRCEED